MRYIFKRGEPKKSYKTEKKILIKWKTNPANETWISSHLMFQVNGEVRLQWLISHFVRKPKIASCH